MLDRAVEVVTRPGDGEAVRGVEDLHHGHLVHGQRAGLVRVDGRGGPQRLHRGEVLDHGVVLGEVHGAQERITCTTVGSASGMAAMASATAVTNRLVHSWPRCSPRTNMTIMVMPATIADPEAHAVELAGERRRLLGRCAASILEMCPTSVSAAGGGDDHPAAAVRDRRVHERHVRAGRAARSPCRRRAPGRSACSAGMLSPVNADSSICRAWAAIRRPSAGHLVAGREQHHVAGHELVGVDLGVGPVAPYPRLRLDHLLEGVHGALPPCPPRACPTTALTTVSTRSSTPVPHCAMTRETTPATSRMICR